MSLREEILNYVEANLTLHIEPYHADEIINKVLDAAVEAVAEALPDNLVFGQQDRAIEAINRLRDE